MIRTLLALLLLVFLGACARHDEVARVTSPDGAMEAVLVESNGGATTSFWYDVYIVETGSPYSKAYSAASLYGATRNENAYGVNLTWNGDSALAIEFREAEQSKVSQPLSRVGKRQVSVSLSPGVTDPTAPPGGMLYNRQVRPHDRS